ncbi:DUF1990 family protein [Pseudonocardia sp.]|uniref:DUF1990 family protein n=1 Tax=Pseudonocardia sp. TaxID=60912 RepID=UPI002625D30C|nr:DUF1990 family protein [Pseudonocardia sp.]
MTATPDVAAALEDLRGRAVNYDEHGAPPAVTDGWHQDHRAVDLGREEPGEPVPDGVAERAHALVEGYEFTTPHLLRAIYRRGSDLVGRDLLLEGRFLRMRFLLGVRITESHDDLRAGPNGPERVVGWSYQTLQGHLEQGRLTYEIVKEIDTGRVTFRIDAYSRQAPIANPVLRLGFSVFGRANQLRFYRSATRRLRALATRPVPYRTVARDGLVHAPSRAPRGRAEAWTLVFPHPGR